MRLLFLDTETRAPADLKKSGLAAYCESGVEVILLSYAYKETFYAPASKVKVWQPLKESMPQDLRVCLRDRNTTIIAHNSRFDRTVMGSDLNILKGYKIPVSRFVCSMVQALEHQLPPGLDLLSKLLLNEDHQKLAKEGKRLINIFCKQHTDKKSKLKKYIHPEDRPEDWKEFIKYAIRDVESMIACVEKMPCYNYPGQKFYTDNIASEEYKSWLLDESINDYGINVDIPLIEKAIDAGNIYAEKLKDDIFYLTKGVVHTPNQRDAILEFLKTRYNKNLPSLTRDIAIKAYIENTNPEVEELLRIRLLGSQSAASKFVKAKDTNVNGLIKHSIQFAGASQTLRYAGRGFQPQNMKRPAYPEGEMKTARELLIEDPKKFVYEMKSPALMLGSLVTGCIIPREGHKLCVCDFSSVESRVIRWHSKDEKGLQFFRAFDAKKFAYDLYMVAYGDSFGVVYEAVTKAQRQIGKPVELSFGFGGGVGAFLNTIKGNFGQVSVIDDVGSYKDLDGFVTTIRHAALEADPEMLELADMAYDFALERGFDHNLSRQQYGAIDYLKQKWRSANTPIVAWWKLLEDAFINAMHVEGVVFRANHIKFLRNKAALYMKLPSEKIITFWNPHTREVKNKKTKIAEVQLTYMGVAKDSCAPKWAPKHIYGGKLAAIATQSTARELLVPKLPKLKDAGYNLVFTKHDEIIAECAANDPVRGYEHLKHIMESPLPWCKDLPVVSAGYETTERYRKD